MFIVNADSLEVIKCMMVKNFNLIGLSNDGVMHLTKDHHDEFILQMLIIEKKSALPDCIEYEMPNDEYNKNLLTIAKSLFSFVDGVVGIGFSSDQSKEINKIQYY